MKKTIAVLALALALLACDHDEAGIDKINLVVSTTPKRSGLHLEYMNLAVRPGDDFDAFVNGRWIDSAVIPADKPAYGVVTMLRDQAQGQVRAIIEESAAGNFARGSDEQKVGDLYASFMDMETRNRLGVAPLLEEFGRIEVLRDYEALAVYFAEANKIGFNMPFELDQYPDFKNPKTYMMYTYQGGLGLPDREFYFLPDKPSAEIRKKYVEHIRRMFDLAGLDDGDAAARMIMALETRIAAEHMSKEQARDWSSLYNKVPRAELSGLMPQFAWASYLRAAGIAAIDGVVVTQLDYMRKLDGIIRDTSLDDWKTYLKWVALNATAELLNESLDGEHFEFYSRTLTGAEKPLPLWHRGVAAVNSNLGEVIGKVYVARHFPPEAKAGMQELVGNLIRAYETSIRELDWMGEETRAQALDKLSKFTAKIGYPDQWKDYSRLEIERQDLVGNLRRAALMEYSRKTERQGGPVDRAEWSTTPQTVNASYSPPLNQITFAAAILQPPFFDLAAEDAVNYGAIGAIIGHEIGHGFDDSGSTFDGDGVLRNWWTDKDRAEFEARTAKLVAQYSAFRPFDDLSVNGEFTLGENIGDLGGLSIGLLAYKISLHGKEPPVLDGYTGWQRVFLGYGQCWRQKYREEALRHEIRTNPHAPRKYRANGVVRNIPEFYAAFDVAPTDALYLSPEERVKIW